MHGFESSVFALEQDGAVATLWLDRPDARNAMGHSFWADLGPALRAVSEDPAVRVLVVAARGPHFSIGLDLKEMGPLLGGGGEGGGGGGGGGEGAGRHTSPGARAAAMRAAIRSMQSTITAVAACPKPVIAAVHGYCIGGGVDLATACDIRLAAADAQFSVRETKMAIVADLGSLQRLPRIVGSGHLAELAFTGMDVDAWRAKEIGLVNGVYEDRGALMSAARQMADAIAALSPLAVQGTKSVLAACEGRSVAEGLDYVATWNAGMLVSDDLAEAMAAFIEKRSPKFTGR